MEFMKQKIHQQLVANVLMDKCAHGENLIFQNAWCSQERVIRFTTKNCRNLFPCSDRTGGKWGTGDTVMYEIENNAETCTVNCIYAPISATGHTDYCLQSWDITNPDANALFQSFDTLINQTIPQFELDLARSNVFTEGRLETFLSTKYERNPQARAACLAHYGDTCRVCGMNFGQTYGADFKGIIEVHHIVPISQIGRDYMVDPIKDLIPVCPNCHAAIHSKSGHKIQFK